MSNGRGPQTAKMTDDLAYFLQRIIQTERRFDKRVQTLLERAEDRRQNPSDPCVEEYYRWCLDALDRMHEVAPDGFVWHFMRGSVWASWGIHCLMKAGQDLASEYYQASEYFDRSQKSFHDCDHDMAEALACIGLGETYFARKDVLRARDAFEQALFALMRVRTTDRTLVDQIHDLAETRLNAVELELVGPRYQRRSTAPDPSPQGSDKPGQGKKIHIYSRVSAGYPAIPPDEDIIDDMVIDESITKGGEFALRVDGTSMVGAGILHGDYAVIRPQPEVQPREIAALAIVQIPGPDREGMLKRVRRYDDPFPHWYLESASDQYAPLVVVTREQHAQPVVESYKKRAKFVKVRIGRVEVAGKLVGLVRSVP